jgi:hypothetical protein
VEFSERKGDLSAVAGGSGIFRGIRPPDEALRASRKFCEHSQISSVSPTTRKIMRPDKAPIPWFIRLLTTILVSPGAVIGTSTGAAELTQQQRNLFDVYKELVEINTSDSVGDTTAAAQAMAANAMAITTDAEPLTTRRWRRSSWRI